MPVTSLWVTFRFAHLNPCFFRSFWHVAHRLILILTSTKLHEQLSWLTDLRALLWLSWVIMSHDCQRSWTDLVPACPNFLTCSHYCNDTSEFRAQFYAVVSGIRWDMDQRLRPRDLQNFRCSACWVPNCPMLGISHIAQYVPNVVGLLIN